MVLRHRGPGDRPAGRAAHPRGPGRLGRRPGLPGRRAPHRAQGPPGRLAHARAGPRPSARPPSRSGRSARCGRKQLRSRCPGVTCIGTNRPAAGTNRGDTEVFADELLRFAGVGAVSTVAYAATFAALEPSLGGYLANAVAIVACSLGNTAAHRGMAGTADSGPRPQSSAGHRGTPSMGVSLAFTTGALAATRAVGLTSLVPEIVRGDSRQRRGRRPPVRHPPHLGVPTPVRHASGRRRRLPGRRAPTGAARRRRPGAPS